MKQGYLDDPADYFTATIHEWKPLLANDNYKDIVIGSLQNLVGKKQDRIKCLRYYEQSHSSHLAGSTEFHANPKPGIVYEIHCATIITLPY